MLDLRQILPDEPMAYYGQRLEQQFLGRYQSQGLRGDQDADSLHDFYRWLFTARSPVPTIEENPQDYIDQKLRQQKKRQRKPSLPVRLLHSVSFIRTI
jgi:hypothetical protein